MNSSASRDIVALEKLANQLRQDIIKMVATAGSGHPGGSLSAVEFITALYFDVMQNIDPKNPRKENRDRFVLSKGHCCPVLYAALARRGYFDVSHLEKLREYQSILQGHPDMNKTPGIDMSTGSLGNGLSVGLGMALSARIRGLDYKVYVMLGDGEMQEGMIWEAAMCAAHHKAKNLIAIVDCNNLQINGTLEEIMNVEPLTDKWRAFGFEVMEVDGHNIAALCDVFEKAKANKSGKPVLIYANTVKGAGVTYMEGHHGWHYGALNEEKFNEAKASLEAYKEKRLAKIN